MSDYEEFWSTLPGKAMHPVRVPIVEALWRIGEPLSALALVDVLDGFMSMWEAAHHLRVLVALGVAEHAPVDIESGRWRDDLFDVPYRLQDRNPAGGA
jgi:hypothetical protein